MKLIVDFALAWLAAFVMASVSHSLFVLKGLIDLNVTISADTWVAAILGDLIGLLPGYGTIIAAGLLIGFWLISVVAKRTGIGSWRYPVAGCLAVAVIHLAMYPIFEVSLIAGARSSLGLFCQLAAGAVGGVVFAIRRNLPLKL